jgi:hypothetical protein
MSVPKVQGKNSIVISLLVWLVPLAGFAETDSYKIISEKNLFRPDRSEWIIDTTENNRLEKEVDPDKLELFGTIIVGDEKRALIYKEEKKGKRTRKSRSRRSRSTRSSRRKEAELYSPGDYLGGYVISEIDEKEVVLDYFGETLTLYLHEGKEPGVGEVTPLEVKKPKTRRKPKKSPKTKSKSRSKKKKTSAQRRAKEIEKQLASGKIPEELADNPFMSKENMKQLLEFNKEIMRDLKESGGALDQAAMKEKVEAFRERFMEKMGAL